MSHPWRSEPGIVLLASVTTVEQAAAAAAAGAGLVDAGDDVARCLHPPGGGRRAVW
jgi:hypothetical protein